MSTEYTVRLIQHGTHQTLTIPPELALPGEEVVIRREGERLIIEPSQRLSLLALLATLPDIEEDFPDGDTGLLPLDDIRF